MTSPASRSSRVRTILGAAAATLALLGPIGASGVAAAAPSSTSTPVPTTPGPGPLVPLADGAATVPAGASVLGSTDPADRVTADVALRPRDPAALAAFARAVSTPGSPRFHRYLPAGQLATRFGPTAATLGATRAWLASKGLEVGPTSANGLLVPVSGTAAAVESAFAVPLVRARLADGRTVRLATRAASAPATLAPAFQGVIGLSTAAKEFPHLARSASHLVPAGTPAVSPSSVGPQACAQITGSSGLTATQLASAYGLSTLFGAGRTGAGQTVGLFELEPYTPSDISAYESCYGIHVPVSNINVDGGPIVSQGQQGEAALDVEAVAGLAPGASIEVYSGPNDNTGAGALDTYARMIADDTAKVISTSWGLCEPLMQTDPGAQAAENTDFAEATVQGQTVLAASGDSGSSDCYVYPVYSTAPAVDDPADQPDVTGVGGTSLSVAPTSSETVWNSVSPLGAGGGGDSTVFEAPSWQQIPAAQSVSTAYSCGTEAPFNLPCREVPDVSASADPNTGDIVFYKGGWTQIGGTSAAAPLWAALVADTNQGCATPAGLLDPQLYSPGAAADFHDITVGNNDMFNKVNPMYPATVGYDLASGWGSPKAPSLLGLLSGSAAGCPTVTGLSPSSGPATGHTPVVISGSGFGTAVPTVTIGGTPVTVTAHTPTSITVLTPVEHSGGARQVVVTTTGVAAGSSPAVAASQFTFLVPQISAVVSNRGPLSGGGTVTIEGSDLTGVSAVQFGSTPATSFRVTSPWTITATVPPGPGAGWTVDVSVRSPSGTSPSVPGDKYTYAVPGYWMVASDGGIFNYGGANFFGSGGGLNLRAPIVSMAPMADDQGYWLASAAGDVFANGAAANYGSAGETPLNKPIAAITATPDGRGYWLVASDGGIFSYGDAQFYGSTGNLVLNRPIVGMAATPDGKGYWLVASDGGIFAYGDAAFYGSTGNLVLNKPVVGMAATPDGRGYWLVATDGGIFAYGDAQFYGSTGGMTLNQPIVGMSPDLTGDGYWLVASDGGIFAYGTARFFGSTGNITLNRPITGMAAT